MQSTGTSEESEWTDTWWEGDLTDISMNFHHSSLFRTLEKQVPILCPLFLFAVVRDQTRGLSNGRQVLPRAIALVSASISFHNFTPSFLHRTENKPSIFLPKSWNCFLFFLSSSSIFWRSSTSCCRRFRASASRSAFERNLGFKTEGNG